MYSQTGDMMSMYKFLDFMQNMNIENIDKSCDEYDEFADLFAKGYAQAFAKAISKDNIQSSQQTASTDDSQRTQTFDSEKHANTMAIKHALIDLDQRIDDNQPLSNLQGNSFIV